MVVIRQNVVLQWAINTRIGASAKADLLLGRIELERCGPALLARYFSHGIPIIDFSKESTIIILMYHTDIVIRLTTTEKCR